MRLRDLINTLTGEFRYARDKAGIKIRFNGSNHKQRRTMRKQARYVFTTDAKPKNWNRDNHKRRKIQNQRRKQAHGLWKPN